MRTQERDDYRRDDRGQDQGFGGGADNYRSNTPPRKVRMARDWPDGSRYDGEW